MTDDIFHGVDRTPHVNRQMKFSAHPEHHDYYHRLALNGCGEICGISKRGVVSQPRLIRASFIHLLVRTTSMSDIGGLFTLTCCALCGLLSLQLSHSFLRCFRVTTRTQIRPSVDVEGSYDVFETPFDGYHEVLLCGSESGRRLYAFVCTMGLFIFMHVNQQRSRAEPRLPEVHKLWCVLNVIENAQQYVLTIYIGPGESAVCGLEGLFGLERI